DSVISDPEHSESLCSDSAAAVKIITLISSRQCKHICSAQLIENFGEAICNCITHKSLCGQLHGPTTFGLESQLHGPTKLQKKVEILF
ncbi:hypothetical protein TSAR_005961, partial [Trichomalopsis sarcophagae]